MPTTETTNSTRIPPNSRAQQLKNRPFDPKRANQKLSDKNYRGYTKGVQQINPEKRGQQNLPFLGENLSEI